MWYRGVHYLLLHTLLLYYYYYYYNYYYYNRHVGIIWKTYFTTMVLAPIYKQPCVIIVETKTIQISLRNVLKFYLGSIILLVH